MSFKHKRRHKHSPSKVRSKLISGSAKAFLLSLATLTIVYCGLLFWNRLYQASQDLYAYLTGYIDLKTSAIQVSGNAIISTQEIIELSNIKIGGDIINLDIDSARSLLLSNAWVKTAEIRRSGFDTIAIHIEEETPQALLRTNADWYLINNTGKKIAIANPNEHDELIMIAGCTAEADITSILTLLGYFPYVKPLVRSLSMSDSRRWDISLRNGVTMKLPAHQEKEALEFVHEHLLEVLKANAPYIVDLRLIPDKLYLRLIKQ